MRCPKCGGYRFDSDGRCLTEHNGKRCGYAMPSASSPNIPLRWIAREPPPRDEPALPSSSNKAQPKMHICPKCGKRSIAWNRHYHIYECFNGQCKWTFTTNEFKGLKGINIFTPKQIEYFKAAHVQEAKGFGAEPIHKEFKAKPKHSDTLNSSKPLIPPNLFLALVILFVIASCTYCMYTYYNNNNQPILTPAIDASPTPSPGEVPLKPSPTIKPSKTPSPSPTPTSVKIDSKAGTYKDYFIGLVKTPSGALGGSDCYGDFIVLINNKNAVNPTYSQLLNFLQVDNTDQFHYQRTFSVIEMYYGSPESHIDLTRIQNIIDGNEQPSLPQKCGDFAERLHNNAEKAGIRCAYVSINLAGYSGGHALNAFQTTDRGLVYIDDTGITSPGPSNCDKTVSLQVGQQYIPQSLFPELGWSSIWESVGTVTDIYMTWDGNWNNRSDN